MTYKLSALSQGASRRVENKPNLFLLNVLNTLIIMRINRKLISLSLGHIRAVPVWQYVKTG